MSMADADAPVARLAAPPAHALPPPAARQRLATSPCPPTETGRTRRLGHPVTAPAPVTVSSALPTAGDRAHSQMRGPCTGVGPLTAAAQQQMLCCPSCRRQAVADLQASCHARVQRRRVAPEVPLEQHAVGCVILHRRHEQRVEAEDRGAQPLDDVPRQLQAAFRRGCAGEPAIRRRRGSAFRRRLWRRATLSMVAQRSTRHCVAHASAQASDHNVISDRGVPDHSPALLFAEAGSGDLSAGWGASIAAFRMHVLRMAIGVCNQAGRESGQGSYRVKVVTVVSCRASCRLRAREVGGSTVSGHWPSLQPPYRRAAPRQHTLAINPVSQSFGSSKGLSVALSTMLRRICRLCPHTAQVSAQHNAGRFARCMSGMRGPTGTSDVRLLPEQMTLSTQWTATPDCMRCACSVPLCARPGLYPR